MVCCDNGPSPTLDTGETPDGNPLDVAIQFGHSYSNLAPVRSSWLIVSIKSVNSEFL